MAKIKNRKRGPPVATAGMCLPLPLNSAPLFLGERKRYPLMIPMYMLAVLNDLALTGGTEPAPEI
jgi:hypothetical protein